MPKICYLPEANMWFSQDGEVRICSYNKKAVLGKYPQNSIKELWGNPVAQDLRKNISEHRLAEAGCSYCEDFIKAKKFYNINPQPFDKYINDISAGFPLVMEFALSSNCNLECIMCNGHVSSAIMRNREKKPVESCPYDSAFVEQLNEFIPHLKEARFYGGEPFLIDIYYSIWDKILALNPAISMYILTNGTIWNAKVENIIRNGNCRMGVSLDAMDKKVYEQIRKNADYDVTMQNILRINKIVRSKNMYLNLSPTPMRNNWQEMPKLVGFANHIEASIWFSFLQQPEELALWNLPKQELVKIHEYLLAQDFPENNSLLKHNKNTYNDFVKQVSGWINAK